jgi:tetratricopeptide (TPR) repeat protein
LNADEYFVQAWELSKHRYGKAQLELGRRYFARKEIAPAVGALQAGLTVSPHANKEWYLLGLICMQLGKHDVALTAFSKVVQLEPTSADAWANIGSIYLAKHEWNRAYSAMEQALRMDRKDWRMWSNFLIACMQLRNFSRAIFVMHEMLDIKRRNADTDPVNIGALGLLVQEVLQSLAAESAPASKSTSNISTPDSIEDAAGAPALHTSLDAVETEATKEVTAEAVSTTQHLDIAGLPCSRYLESVAKLFGHITSVVTNQPKVWHLYAIVQKARGRAPDATECKLKMCRALQTAGWEKEEACITSLARASEQLVDDYMHPRTVQSTLQARMYLTAVLGKIDAARVFSNHPAVAPLRSLLQSVDPSTMSSEVK